MPKRKARATVNGLYESVSHRTRSRRLGDSGETVKKESVAHVKTKKISVESRRRSPRLESLDAPSRRATGNKAGSSLSHVLIDAKERMTTRSSSADTQWPALCVLEGERTKMTEETVFARSTRGSRARSAPSKEALSCRAIGQNACRKESISSSSRQLRSRSVPRGSLARKEQQQGVTSIGRDDLKPERRVARVEARGWTNGRRQRREIRQEGRQKPSRVGTAGRKEGTRARNTQRRTRQRGESSSSMVQTAATTGKKAAVHDNEVEADFSDDNADAIKDVKKLASPCALVAITIPPSPSVTPPKSDSPCVSFQRAHSAVFQVGEGSEKQWSGEDSDDGGFAYVETPDSYKKKLVDFGRRLRCGLKTHRRKNLLSSSFSTLQRRTGSPLDAMRSKSSGVSRELSASSQRFQELMVEEVRRLPGGARCGLEVDHEEEMLEGSSDDDGAWEDERSGVELH